MSPRAKRRRPWTWRDLRHWLRGSRPKLCPLTPADLRELERSLARLPRPHR